MSSFRKIKPTKPNLDNLKRRRNFAERGKHLLELKRQQMLLEFKRYMKEYTTEDTILNAKIESAYKNLNLSFMANGKKRVRLAAGVNKIVYEPIVSIQYINYKGIETPKIKFDMKVINQLPAYSLQDTPIQLDETVVKLKDLMQDIMKLAELDHIIFNLAFNYQRIQRRINSLDEIMIPRLNNDIGAIEDILEDIEREEIIRMKEIRKSLEQKHSNEVEKYRAETEES